MMALLPQAGSKGNVMIQVYSLFLEGTVLVRAGKALEKTCPGNRERLVGPIAGSR